MQAGLRPLFLCPLNRPGGHHRISVKEKMAAYQLKPLAHVLPTFFPTQHSNNNSKATQQQHTTITATFNRYRVAQYGQNI